MTYKLCKECKLKPECLKACSDAIKFELQDQSGNYMDSKEYKPKGTSTTFYDMRRGSGGLSKFK